MAEQLLSQVEVDALLRGLSDGEIQTEQEIVVGSEDGVEVFDFKNQDRTVRARMPTLEMINTKFSRNARSPIFNILKKAVDIQAEDVSMVKFGEFLKNLPVPSSMNIFQMTPLRGQGILAIDPNLVFLVVDNYFGGDGRFHMRVEGRDFTSLEQAVIKKVVDVIFSELQGVWKSVYPLDFTHVRSEMNPHFANIVGSSEIIVLSTFNMEIESKGHKFFILFPYSSVEPIKDKLFGMMQAESAVVDKRWSERLKELVGYVPLDTVTEVGKADITLKDIINLNVGDVIQMNKKIDEPFKTYIEGTQKFDVRPGYSGSNYSVEIISAADKEES